MAPDYEMGDERMLVRLAGLIVAAITMMSAPSWGASLQDFEGDWAGAGLMSGDGRTQVRELDFKLNAPLARQGGFLVLALWRPAGTADQPAQPRGMEFVPTARANLWQSQAACDPLIPAGCGWARLDGDLLTVTTLAIDSAGRIEMQITRRLLSDGVIQASFMSLVDGEVRRTLNARLVRRKLD